MILSRNTILACIAIQKALYYSIIFTTFEVVCPFTYLFLRWKDLSFIAEFTNAQIYMADRNFCMAHFLTSIALATIKYILSVVHGWGKITMGISDYY